MPARDPLFSPWSRAGIGEPVPVRTVTGRRSYWLVPVAAESRAIGFVRVSLDGRVMAVGALYRDPGRLEKAPAVVTGITASEARDRIADVLEPGATADDPIYVYEGSPGREAWMVAIRRPGHASRYFFVTAGGSYERSPDELARGPSDLEG
jgi:hypothetical protein